jgi:hypothetical protein
VIVKDQQEQCFIQTPIYRLRGGGQMKGGEGEGAHRATFFGLLTGIIGGNSEVLGGKVPP